MIVGVTGQSGAGKDQVASILREKYRFIVLSLADPLKRICREVYGFTEDQLWGPSERRNAPDFRYPVNGGHLSPRVALQTLGTEWGRTVYPNTWIDYALRMIDYISSGYNYDKQKGLVRRHLWDFRKRPRGVVIPDIRFRNELQRIHAENGYVVRITRPGKTGNVGIQGHASEEEQKNILNSELDYVISNNGSLYDLECAVDKMFYMLPSVPKLKSIPGGKVSNG